MCKTAGAETKIGMIDGPETWLAEDLFAKVRGSVEVVNERITFEERFVTIESEDDEDPDLKRMWGLINESLPADWDDEETDEHLGAGLLWRKTGFSIGLDGVLLEHFLKRFSAEALIRNTAIVYNAIVDPKIDKEKRDAIARVASYFFVPIVKTLENPSLSLLLENAVFERLDEGGYESALEHWKTQYGVDYYDDGIIPNIEEVLKKELEDESIGLKEGEYSLLIRKKSLFEFIGKKEVKDVNDGYAITLALERTEHLNSLIAQGKLSGKKMGRVIEEEILNKITSSTSLKAWASTEDGFSHAKNSIDKGRSYNRGYRVVQQILEPILGKENLPGRFELRIALAEDSDINAESHPWFKIFIQSLRRLGVEEERLLYIGRLSRAMMKDFVSDDEDIYRDQIEEPISSGRTFPIGLHRGRDTIMVKPYDSQPVWDYLTDVFASVGKYTIKGIEQIRVERNEPLGNGVYCRREFIVNGSTVIEYDPDTGEQILTMEPFVIKPFDKITPETLVGTEFIESVEVGDFLYWLVFKDKRAFDDKYLSMKLPMKNYLKGGEHIDLRERLLRHWGGEFERHFKGLDVLLSEYLNEKSPLYLKIKTEMESVMTLVDILRYVEHEGELGKDDIKYAKKLLLGISSPEAIEYLTHLIDGNELYKGVISDILDFDNYRKNGSLYKFDVFWSNSWLNLAQTLKENKFTYLFKLMDKQIFDEIIPEEDKITLAHLITDCRYGKKNPFVIEVFDIDEEIFDKSTLSKIRRLHKIYKKGEIGWSEIRGASDNEDILATVVAKWVRLENAKGMVTNDLFDNILKAGSRSKAIFAKFALELVQPDNIDGFVSLLNQSDNPYKILEVFMESLNLFDSIKAYEFYGVREQSFILYSTVLLRLKNIPGVYRQDLMDRLVNQFRGSSGSNGRYYREATVNAYLKEILALDYGEDVLKLLGVSNLPV